jgi:hypothetical protein
MKEKPTKFDVRHADVSHKAAVKHINELIDDDAEMARHQNLDKFRDAHWSGQPEEERSAVVGILRTVARDYPRELSGINTILADPHFSKLKAAYLKARSQPSNPRPADLLVQTFALEDAGQYVLGCVAAAAAPTTLGGLSRPLAVTT